MFNKNTKNKKSLFDRIFGISSVQKSTPLVSVKKNIVVESSLIEKVIQQPNDFAEEVFTDASHEPLKEQEILSYPDFVESTEQVIEQPNFLEAEEAVEQQNDVIEEVVDSPNETTEEQEILSYPDFSELVEQKINESLSFDPTNKIESRNIKAHRYISEEECFVLVSGEKLQSLMELREILRGMPANVWSSHVTKERNDFANWIEYVSQDSLLSYHSRACTNPEALRILLSISL